ncbi:MAG: hypothetical protein JXR68_11965 [Bacteroidales bacterium]|nr:hypothetical protein [Bacteroidales bacterium]
MKLIKNFLFFTFVFLTITNSLFSQKETQKLALCEVLTIHSKVLDEDRKIIVSVPEFYDGIMDKEYPVLYVLDGKEHYFHASAAVDFLSTRGYIPEMIVVSIVNVNRNRDFAPYVPNVERPNDADDFLQFLDKELVPFIDKKYKTSDYRTIIGHSLGGTFITFSLLEKPELFNSYIAISPYLNYSNGIMLVKAENKLKKRYKSDQSFYMTVGDEPAYFDALDKFSAMMQDRINFKYLKTEGENHGSIPYTGIYNGLRFVFSDWLMPKEIVLKGSVAIDNYSSKLSSKYGYERQIGETYINQLGYEYLNEGDYENAIKVFKTNVERYPNSPNVYDSLGEAYEKNNQLKLAEENYQKAYDLAVKYNHFNKSIYKQNLERVQSNK